MSKYKPKKLSRRKRDAFETLIKFFQSIPKPGTAAMRQRMAELREMGFEDLPEFEGLDSSVRQYACASIAYQEGRSDSNACFVTGNMTLIFKAGELKARFGLPVFSKCFNHPDSIAVMK